MNKNERKNILHDWCHPIGILFLKYGYRAIYDAASSIDFTVFSVSYYRDLVWPPVKSEGLMCIQKQVKFDCNYTRRQTYLDFCKIKKIHL